MKNTKPIYYKVCRKLRISGEEKNVSAYCLGRGSERLYKPELQDKAWLSYDLGKKTVPVKGGIFVFTNLAEAKEFMPYNGEFVIFEGTGPVSRQKPRIISSSNSYDEMNFEDMLSSVWRPNQTAWKYAKPLEDAYANAVMLKHFTPTKIVT